VRAVKEMKMKIWLVKIDLAVNSSLRLLCADRCLCDLRFRAAVRG